jgi:hypothetical protein
MIFGKKETRHVVPTEQHNGFLLMSDLVIWRCNQVLS